MKHSLVRMFSIVAIFGVASQAEAYSARDMHELLWFMFRQHPNGVDAIYAEQTVLLPPQEDRFFVPERFSTGAYRVVVPVLWAGQWSVAIARFERRDGEVKRRVTFYETTQPVRDFPDGVVDDFETRIRNTRKLDGEQAASGPIVAQFILQLFGLTDSYDTVESMRSRHLSFLQRRRELMTARRNVNVLEHRQNESGVESFIAPVRVEALLVTSR